MSVSAAADPEAAYYQTVEEFFVSRRGDPIMLSNADWLLVHRWREQGIPLRIVLRGVADALDGHAHSWGRRRKVGSLAYCAAEVEAARERWQRALAGDDQGERALADALVALAGQLEAAPSLGRRSSALAASLAGDLRQRAEAPGDPAELEAWLGQGERSLLDALRAETPAERLGAHEAEIDGVLAPYRERMPARVLARLRGESLARRLLAEHGLPRLTLFT